MARTYDVIVLGLGGMGSSALWHLARRGVRVLGLERYDLGHAMGSSHGFNRIIRLAYFEHPDYVPLLRRAYELWRETENLSGKRLLYVTGSIDAGPEGSSMIEGALESCRRHALPFTLLDARGTQRRFPGYRLPENHVAVYQPDGGFVASGRAIFAHIGLALGAGAEVRAREPVIGIEPGGRGVRVSTEKGQYEAGRVIVATGAWIADLIPELAGKAVPERQVLGWFQPKRPEIFALGRFPVSIVQSDAGYFYQFPTWGHPGFKIGLHHHLREQVHPDNFSREPNAADEEALRRGLRLLFPDADGPVLRLTTCLYTNTPDEHFVIDVMPGQPQIIVASPCSGHGFKFASVIGELLADLASTGAARQPISLFRLDRLLGAPAPKVAAEP
jgi:sarcosine oxidase